MIEKRTIFVLGAGASCPYGFPTARGLRSDIINKFPTRYEKLLADRASRGVPGINSPYPRVEVARDFVGRFDRSSTESVDLFLSRNPALAKIGRMAICLSVLYAERHSHFREEVQNPNQDWCFGLFSRLSRDLTDKSALQEFSKNNVAFVTFNYDRSLEHFLYESVLNSFEEADPTTVAEQVNRLVTIHVYGALAPLDWQVTDPQNALEYGKYGALPHLNLPVVADNLHIVHEKKENPNIEKAREQISKADRIFFLGFGYARENLEALGFPDVAKRSHYMYGTAMGRAPKEIKEIRREFTNALQHSGNTSPYVDRQVQITDCDCVALLREFL